MKLICGLGNPGIKYLNTRHNIGFLVVDALVDYFELGPAKTEHQAKTWKTQHNQEAVLLAQPQTFMNKSGEAVLELQQYYKLELSDILIVHDEVDLGFGGLKFQTQRSPGGHNGIKDIHNKLASDTYCRLRLGVGRPSNPHVPMADFVLQNFSAEELDRLPQFIEQAGEAVLCFLEEGLMAASTKFNGKEIK